MINCGECSGSKQALCIEAFDTYKKAFIEDMNSNSDDFDPFTAAQTIGLLGRVLSGDTTALEHMTSDPILGGSSVTNAQESTKALVSEVRSFGCALEPHQIIMKAMFGSIQDVILEEAAAAANYDSLLPSVQERRPALLEGLEDDENISPEFKERARELDDILSRIESETTSIRPQFETEEQKESRLKQILEGSEELIGSTHRLLDTVKRDVEIDKQNARTQYIVEQGWDPENLDFSQKLDVKAHLKELGY